MKPSAVPVRAVHMSLLPLLLMRNGCMIQQANCNPSRKLVLPLFATMIVQKCLLAQQHCHFMTVRCGEWRVRCARPRHRGMVNTPSVRLTGCIAWRRPSCCLCLSVRCAVEVNVQIGPQLLPRSLATQVTNSITRHRQYPHLTTNPNHCCNKDN